MRRDRMLRGTGSNAWEDDAVKRLRAIATSLTLIVAIAFVARVGFAVSQARKIPDAALAHVPFENETGSIAQAIATGQGFSNPFARNTGPTAWLTPVYPWLVVCDIQDFWRFHDSRVLLSCFPQHCVFVGRLCAALCCGAAHRGCRSRRGGGLAVGDLSECGDDAVRMDLGYVAGGAAVGRVAVGDDALGGIAADARLVRCTDCCGDSC